MSSAVLSWTAMPASVAKAARRTYSRLSRGPLRDLRPGVWGAIEEVAAAGVADVPGMEVADPAIHGGARDGLGIAHEAGEDTGLVDTGGPEFFGERLALAGAAGDGADLRDGQAERRGGVDTEARHAFAIGWIGQSAHFADDFFSSSKALG